MKAPGDHAQPLYLAVPQGVTRIVLVLHQSPAQALDMLPREDVVCSAAPVGVPTLPQAVLEWARELEARGVRDRTRKLARVRRAASDAGWARLDEVTPEAVRQYLTARRLGEHGERIKAKTHDQYLGDLTGLFELAVRRGWVAENPARGVPRLSHRAAEDSDGMGAFTPEEVAAIIDAAIRDEALPPRHERRRRVARRAALYLLLYHTGIRKNAAQTLRWGDLNLGAAPTVRIRKSSAKNAREQTIAIVPEVADALRDLRPAIADAADRIWPKTIQHCVLRDDMKAAGVAVHGPDGLPRAYHSFRVTLATLLHDGGVRIKAIQTAMGHQDIKTTLGYIKTHVSVDREVMTVMPPVAHGNIPRFAREDLTRSGETADDDGAVGKEPMTVPQHNASSAEPRRGIDHGLVLQRHRGSADVASEHARPPLAQEPERRGGDSNPRLPRSGAGRGARSGDAASHLISLSSSRGAACADIPARRGGPTDPTAGPAPDHGLLSRPGRDATGTARALPDHHAALEAASAMLEAAAALLRAVEREGVTDDRPGDTHGQ